MIQQLQLNKMGNQKSLNLNFKCSNGGLVLMMSTSIVRLISVAKQMRCAVEMGLVPTTISLLLCICFLCIDRLIAMETASSG